MPSLYRIRMLWTGFQGAPGYTNLYYTTQSPSDSEATTVAAGAKAAFTLIAAHLPVDVTITADTDVQVEDSATSKVTGHITVSVSGSVTGTATDAYSAPSGAAVTWHTGQFFNGREVRGRTYIVPLVGYDPDGTLSATTITALRSFGDQLITDSSTESPYFTVRSPASQAAAGGSTNRVQSAQITDKAAVLRSRRD